MSYNADTQDAITSIAKYSKSHGISEEDCLAFTFELLNDVERDLSDEDAEKLPAKIHAIYTS